MSMEKEAEGVYIEKAKVPRLNPTLAEKKKSRDTVILIHEIEKVLPCRREPPDSTV